MDQQPWRALAACQDEDVELFFPVRAEDEGPAKAICETCPVKEPCAEYAIEHESHGVWGGLGERDRPRVKRRRQYLRARRAVA